MIVTERFELNPFFKRALKNRQEQFGFGLLGAVVYARTYSRLKSNGDQERWADTVIRVVEGVLSIRKWWYTSHRLPWDEAYWGEVGIRLANAIFDMRFLPPGRGLWAMGTDYVYDRGAMALQNCGYVDVTKLSRDAAWAMDALMCGVGTGQGLNDLPPFHRPVVDNPRTIIIPDSREGWVDSVKALIESYERPNQQRVLFDYSQIRPYGELIRGFGGVASGPDPLMKLHERIVGYLESGNSSTRIITDVFNAIGACVVAGNVRRSAEITLGSPSDSEFLDLKNYDLYPDRQEIGWMSNNSVRINSVQDFQHLPEIAERIVANGEPGILNVLNLQKYGRYGDLLGDTATGCNPCGEQGLEDKEVCCLVECFPTKSNSDAEFFDAIELAQIYAHTVSLLPTHSDETNAVVARNHRIGEGLSGIADWFDVSGASPIITLQREGYKHVRETNQRLAKEAGVPESIRVTTVKPSGTVSQLAGVSPGMHYPPYTRYVRRVRVGEGTPIVDLLQKANVPYEKDQYSDNTLVFEFPVESRARRSQREISMWQKGAMVQLLQKHWSDNMVSNTVTFNPKTEAHQIEDFLAHTIPFTKSLSLLPDTDEGAYAQMPYEGITKSEYEKRLKDIQEIDWNTFGGSDGQDSRFCGNDGCEA